VSGAEVSFALDISKVCQKFGIDAHVAARKIILDIQKDVMLATPVDTGLLRSNFFVGISAPPSATTTTSDSGNGARAAAAAALAAFQWGQTVYLTNNLPYANLIEFGGSKVKAPAGMLRVTVARYQAQFGRWS
jgi:hypothetical protein